MVSAFIFVMISVGVLAGTKKPSRSRNVWHPYSRAPGDRNLEIESHRLHAVVHKVQILMNPPPLIERLSTSPSVRDRILPASVEKALLVRNIREA